MRESLPIRAEDLTEAYDWMISRAVRPDDVLKLNLAPHVAVLGTEGEKLPWGEDTLERNVPRGTSETAVPRGTLTRAALI